MLNLAVDGDTSTGVLSRLPAITEHQPDHVLIMVGTNDGQGHVGNRIPWISDRETERNLEAIGSGLREGGSEVTWIAPPPIRIADIERHWYVGELPIGWSIERHESKRQIVLSQGGVGYDAAAALGQRAADFLDGLHPSLEGHLRLTRGLVESLSSISS
jgi:lysophospholipase L1-like esterase